MIAIRGATTIDSNTAQEIKNASAELFSEVINRNNVNLGDIVSIIFSCTKDITKAFPGKFIREDFNLNDVAIMHFNEMEVEGSLPLCIRIMVMVNSNYKDDIKFVYLRNSTILRKDLF